MFFCHRITDACADDVKSQPIWVQNTAHTINNDCVHLEHLCLRCVLEHAQSFPNHVRHFGQDEKGLHQWVKTDQISTCEVCIWHGVGTSLTAPDDDVDAARDVDLHTGSTGPNVMPHKRLQPVLALIVCNLKMCQAVTHKQSESDCVSACLV